MIQLLCFVTAFAGILFTLMCMCQLLIAFHDWTDERYGAGIRMVAWILAMCACMFITGMAFRYGNGPVQQVQEQEGR
jgi:O-antigen ligase